jgi:hypothetical protein
MSYDFFNFKLLEVVHEVKGRSAEVCSMLGGFMIQGQQGGVEHVMNGPGYREFQAISHGGNSFQDYEGSMTLRG